jgi:hypothetical protein
MKWLVGMVALLVLVALFNRPAQVPIAGGGAAAVLPAAAEPTGSPAPVNNPGITVAEFAALETGMTRAQVAAVVGSAGEVISESEIAGIHTVMVQWPAETGWSRGANANAMLQDDRLVQKAQSGLR